MALFLSGVLCGARATQERHLKQAQLMQAAIQNRWKRDTPWAWRDKHLRWFLTHYMAKRAISTRYYYWLTILLILQRMKRSPRLAQSWEVWANHHSSRRAIGNVKR